ncbi:peptide chain release factor 1 [Candidatus Dojkabacteria bacterium]|nr:peptide chain release factor 1 [Candidatus Dojkabacteria bacterium]
MKMLPLSEQIENTKNEFIVLKEKIESGNATGPDYKKFSTLEVIASKTDELKKAQADLDEAKSLQNSTDTEMATFAKEEISRLNSLIPVLETDISKLLNPSDEDRFSNTIIEIRAGAGGDEAGIFASDLKRMYTLFAQRQGWKVSVLDEHENESGGIKSSVLRFEGDTAYKTLLRESGVHRVQRVPVTESSGRIHTSTASVAVLPELSDIEIEINPTDIIVEACKSSGPGGQSVNTTDSAIRLTHKPTGIVINCRENKSQIQNRARAMQMLQSQLYQREKEEREENLKGQRSSQIGTGDRSEKIRTYNFPQDRVTDHRIKKSWHNLPKIMDGFIDELVDN